MQITKNFNLSELLDSATARRMNYNEQFDPPQHVINNLVELCINILQPLRTHLGKSIMVTSGYRCERLNKRVKGARNSQHLFGQAADIKVVGMTTNEIVDEIISLDLPFDQVIEEFGSWVHVSYSNTPFNRKEALRAIKRNNRTVYIPYNIIK